MGLEKVGSQFRIRVESPKRFQKKSFKTLDPGMPGGLQFVRAVPKGKKNIAKNLKTQSIRVDVEDFNRRGDKLFPKTPRGRREARSLKKQKNGRVEAAIDRYF